MAEQERPVRDPSLVDAVIPLVTLAVLIGGSLVLFGLDALDGPIQVALLLCAMVGALIALKNRHTWDQVQCAAVTQDELLYRFRLRQPCSPLVRRP